MLWFARGDMGLSVLKADSVVRYVCGHCTLSVSCSLTSVFFLPFSILWHTQGDGYESSDYGKTPKGKDGVR